MSIIIPAFNEGPLVRASLEHMLEDAEPGEFEVIVVPNGCTDETAAVAASVAGTTVVSIPQPSKTAALNAGDAAAATFPRAYIDADVRVSTAALRALADALSNESEPRVAAPTLVVDATASTLAVRQFTRVWALSDYRRHGHVGSGIYAVNRAGRQRWSQLPDVIADDRFVQQRFLPQERISLASHTFTVSAPRDMPTLVRRGTRIEIGNRELPRDAQLAREQPATARYSRLIGRVARAPRLWLALSFYAYGHGVPKLRARNAARSGRREWARDDALRQAARA